MKLMQLSIFAENKPGHLSGPCRLLAAEGIDIRALTLADTQKYGILRLLVSDPEKATAVLEAAGHIVNSTEVVAVEVTDQPGGLSSVLIALDGSGVNIDYVYASPFSRDNRAILIFRFNDPDKAMAVLRASGITIVEHSL